MGKPTFAYVPNPLPGECPVEIPWEWDDVLCHCVEGKTPSIQQIGSGKSNKHCLECGKILRWTILRCTNCDNLYDYLFRHSAIKEGGWAKQKGWCWNCICAQDPATEQDLPPAFPDKPRELRPSEEIMAEIEGLLEADFNFEL